MLLCHRWQTKLIEERIINIGRFYESDRFYQVVSLLRRLQRDQEEPSLYLTVQCCSIGRVWTLLECGGADLPLY
jgi:hypothetical protein